MQEKVCFYPRGNDQYIAIFPAIPQWMMLDSTGIEIAEALFNKDIALESVVRNYPEEMAEEIRDTGTELLAIIAERQMQQQLPKIEGVLTDRTTVAMISLTRLCNLRCSHCYVDACGSRPEEMSLDDHIQLAGEIREVLCKSDDVAYSVALTGGEPFLVPGIIRIIAAYRAQDLSVGISTNGLLVEKEMFTFLREEQVTLSISLDGSDAEMHEMIRGKGTFDATIKKISDLVSAGIHVGVNTLVHTGNVHQLEKIVEIAHGLGCSGLNPINLVQLGRACDSSLKRASDVEIFRRLADHVAANPNRLHLFERTSMFSSLGAALLAGVSCSSCGVGNRPCVYIDSDGTVYPCANTQRAEFALGNVRTQPLADCARADHPTLRELGSLDVENMNPKCGRCPVRKFCGGDCRGETYNVTGAIRAPYIACLDRHNSLLELMAIIAEYPWIFETRADEYIKNASR